MSKVKLGAKPFLMPLPATLVGALINGKPNYMVAAWCGMVNSSPPILSVALQPSRYTNVGLKAQRTFSVNLPPADLVKETDYCGLVSGAEEDKSGLFTTYFGVLETAPLIEECALSLECQLLQSLDLPSHQLHLGQIIEVHAEESCLVDGQPDLSKIDPLLYSSAERHYWRVGQRFAPAFKIGRELKR